MADEQTVQRKVIGKKIIGLGKDAEGKPKDAEVGDMVTVTQRQLAAIGSARLAELTADDVHAAPKAEEPHAAPQLQHRPEARRER